MAADDTTDTNEVSHASLATAVLEVDVGVWDGEQAITPRPGADTVRMTSVSTRTMLADRWLIIDNVASSGYVGHGVYGWDASAQCYAGIWVDSMMGSIAHATGTYDLRTLTLTYDVEIAHGGRTIKYREVITRPDDDTRQYVQYIPLPDGGEHPMITITYRRRR